MTVAQGIYRKLFFLMLGASCLFVTGFIFYIQPGYGNRLNMLANSTIDGYNRKLDMNGIIYREGRNRENNKTTFQIIPVPMEDLKGNRDVTKSDLKVILLWNSFYKSRDYGVGAFGREAFTSHGCRQDRCILSTDRGFLNQSAAVVFHMRGNVNPFPAHVNQRQLFVYFLRESPKQTFETSHKYTTRFNVTMTYRRDSDIPVPISRLVPVNPVNITQYILKYPLSSRPGSMVWLVSHCETSSKREKYASALAKYIDLDIYGACGKFNCSRKQPCMADFEKKYKFYLGFENSYCDDYVTEKYYRTLKYELIPIVYGAVNYTSLGPSRAFINILDYRSPKHLADYLHYLAQNETAYSEYFQTRPYWKSVNVLGPAFCDLCELAHRPTYRRTYEDVHAWWTNGACDMATVERVVDSTKL